jgi:hypothetical protein
MVENRTKNIKTMAPIGEKTSFGCRDLSMISPPDLNS